MSNPRKTKANNVEEKIIDTWEMVVEEGMYPSVAAFSKMAGISSSTLYHNYKEWARKVTARRDKKHGKKKKSPVTLSRKHEDLKHAHEQIKLLQSENYRLSKRLEEVERETKQLRLENEQMEVVKEQNEFILGGYKYLISQLQMAGVKQEKIRMIWKAFEKNILPVDDSGE